MNLQDRIVEILCDRTNDFKPIEEVAKAILALVEEDKLRMTGTSTPPDTEGDTIGALEKLVTPTVSEQCCDVCKCKNMTKDHQFVMGIHTCDNPTCPCHSPSSGVEERYSICSAHQIPDPNCRLCKIFITDAPVEPTAPVGVWEGEFENKFCAWDSKWTWAINSDANPQNVKDFIRQTIKNREREIAEEVANMTVDLCENSQKFKDDVLALLNKQ